MLDLDILWQHLIAQRRLVAAILLLSLVGGGTYASLQPKVYRGEVVYLLSNPPIKVESIALSALVKREKRLLTAKGVSEIVGVINQAQIATIFGPDSGVRSLQAKNFSYHGDVLVKVQLFSQNLSSMPQDFQKLFDYLKNIPVLKKIGENQKSILQEKQKNVGDALKAAEKWIRHLPDDPKKNRFKKSWF